MLPLPFFQRVVLFFENNQCLLLFSEFPSSFLPFFSRASLLSFCKASFFIFLGSSLPLSFRVSFFSKLGDNNVITVKPFHSKHHQDLKIVSVTERCPLHRGSSQIGSFCFKTCSRKLGYSTIDPKVFKEAHVARRESLKTIYQRISYLYDNLEATGWLVYAMRERTNQRNGQECCYCRSY